MSVDFNVKKGTDCEKIILIFKNYLFYIQAYSEKLWLNKRLFLYFNIFKLFSG